MNLGFKTIPHAAFLFLTTASAWAQPQTATLDAINQVVGAAVGNAADRSYTICELDAALWGNYTVQVGVPPTSTVGKQALIFQVAGGILTQQVNSNPSGIPFAAASQPTGTVFLPDRDAAFARGLPLWIGDVSFPGPDPSLVQFTRYTNPALTGSSIAALASVSNEFETIVPGSLNQGIGIDGVVAYGHLAPGSQPQMFTGGPCADPRNSGDCSGALNPAFEYYLWSGIGSTGSPLTCPVSNQVDLAAASVNTPSIRRRLSVLQSFDNSGIISSGTWVQIFGEKLSTTTRSWSSSDFQGALAPTSLDGVRVNVNGKPAFISYISPNQINAQVPDDAAAGPVTVQVINAAGTSNSVQVTKVPASPALLTTPSFLVNGKQYVAALFPDNATFVGPENFIPGVTSRPAKPGETIIVYAVGCGPTAAPSGQVLSQAQPITATIVQFDQATAQAQGFLAAGSVGLCQFNITVPEVPDGDVMISLSIAGWPATPLYTSVRH